MRYNPTQAQNDRTLVNKFQSKNRSEQPLLKYALFATDLKTNSKTPYFDFTNVDWKQEG
jgi:hypothetical protein